MEEIIIRNIGPVKSISIQLNKVNVFIGQQSSGKSTIAKIISYCQWVEKRLITDGEFEYQFSEQFLEFHRIDKNYFNADSLIQYKSDFITILYKGLNYNQEIKLNSENLKNYSRSKNIYIPAERNFVSSIPNLNKYNETNDNIMSFLYDWHDAKREYSEKKSLSILDLGISYFNSEKDLDHLKLKNKKKTISLHNASSGLQSVVPLVILIDYLTNGLLKKTIPLSVKEKYNFILNDKSSIEKFINEEIKKIETQKEHLDSLSLKDVRTATLEIKELYQRLNNLRYLVEFRTDSSKSYSFSKIIIEEPEQNLFPSTQRDLIYYIIREVFNKEKKHSLTLTTHSPYVLYALNNCILANIVEEKLSVKEKSNLPCLDSKISPELISIYELRNGEIKSIQQKDGLIGENFFDNKMKEIMDEFYIMLNHYD